MSTASVEPGTKMRFEEFMALPDDGIRRELIRGRDEVFPSDDETPGPGWAERPMTIRNRAHCRLLITLGCEWENWLRTRPRPCGEFVGGECGFRLRGPDDTAIGIELAYASAEQVAAMPPEVKVFISPPALAVEILSPSDSQQDVADMLELHHESGVIVWIGYPDLRSFSVHRPGGPPEFFNETQELVGDPYLPGFRVPVARLFE